MTNKKTEVQLSSFKTPVVAVLGHVDHGKTSLLDTIRKTNIVSQEHGGITQHIGAYQIPGITFIDTPGHEAFAAMRSRGALASDIALLVVAANDSVMPQTVESIRMIKEAGIPMIVVINKIDHPEANSDKVKQDLAKAEIQLEGFGGNIPFVLVSAKTGSGITQLLDLIKLTGEMQELKNEPEASFEGVVIETRVDKGKGLVATVIVKKGTLKRTTELFDENIHVGRVRAMFDELGVGVTEALPGKPVEVLGFTKLPRVGTILHIQPIALKQVSQPPEEHKELSLPDFLKPIVTQKKLKLILKTDTAGSLEAVLQALGETTDLVDSGVGDIMEGDVLLAKSTGAIIIGFNVKINGSIEKLAQTEGVVFRIYTIIYQLLDEMREVVAGMKEVISGERELGTGTVIAEFPFDHSRIAGTKVTNGRLARGDQVKILREEKEIARVKIKSLRVGKEERTKAETPAECGILFDRNVDFNLADVIMAVTKN